MNEPPSSPAAKPAKFKYIPLGQSLYRDSRTGNLFHRPKINGAYTFRKLVATTATMARKEMATLSVRQMEANLGIALDPYAKLTTIGKIAGEWKAISCPDRKGTPRRDQSLQDEIARLNRLLPFWTSREARQITPEDCRDYHGWRIKQRLKKLKAHQAAPFTLNRSVDAELQTLSNLLSWAAQHPRKTQIKANPIGSGRPKFHLTEDIRHCTEVMPMSDEIFHQLATYLLSSDRSRSLGWQFLLEGLTGARTSEILLCRTDASKPREPGYQDEAAVHLNRMKKGIEPWALLEVIPGHAPLREMLAAFHHWHETRYAHTPWFVPGHKANQCMTRGALNHALIRACKDLGLPKITSHGLRAYFVRTLRSLGVDDSEIAKRLGHRSGVSLVEKTYGLSEPGWFNSKRLDFLPTGPDYPIAWTPWLPPTNANIISISAYNRHTQTDKIESTLTHHSKESEVNKSPENIAKTALTN